MTSTGARQGPLPDGERRRDIALPATPISCRMAREFVVSVIGGAEDPRVALVVTELVANAVVHGHAEPHLWVGWDGQTVNVEVEDDGPGRPVLRSPDPLTPSGRGLALVDRIADAWGVEDTPGYAERGAGRDGGPGLDGGAGPDGDAGRAKADRHKVVWARIRLD